MKINLRPKILILFGARTLGLFNLSRYLTRSQLRILCYHGGVIGDEDGYNPKLFCSSETLHSRMKWMQSRGFRFVTLDDGVKQQAGAGAKAPLRTVVTFDDGWYSTHSKLLPVLAELQIPSTLYLCTKNFLEGWPILNVTVRYTIWKAGQRSVSLRRWGTAENGTYDLKNVSERNRLIDSVVNAIARSTNSREQVCAALERFAEDLGVGAAALQLESRRFDYVTRQEVLDVAGQGCSVESHGHVHEYPKGRPHQFAEDLRQCEETIVGLGLGRPRHYCYPSGSFGEEATVTLRELGIRSATTCIPGLVNEVDGKHRHYLPRFLDGEDVHQLEFEAEMSGFSDLMRGAIRIIKRRPSLQLELAEPVNTEA
jgi:peptidoglycan/xylan/chitin deacetylase (PgdA/CDA1 family)